LTVYIFIQKNACSYFQMMYTIFSKVMPSDIIYLK